MYNFRLFARLISFTLFSFAVTTYSQIFLTGYVNTAGLNPEPLQNIKVELLDQADTTIAYNSITNSEGYYSIEIVETGVDKNKIKTPASFKLNQNYPNPFNPSTIISFELLHPANLKLEIYNVLGQKIKTLFDGYQADLYGSTIWNGTNDYGKGVAAGVYIYSLSVENGPRINKKMLMLDGHLGHVKSADYSTNLKMHKSVPDLNNKQSNNFILRVSGDSIAIYTESIQLTNSMSKDISVYKTISDIDGNVYKIVKIGDQWWMAENLAVTHYLNGDPISNITDTNEWTESTEGAFCYYDNDINYSTVYGALYNWFTLNDSRGLAPDGWHVASDEEWKELEMYLGMSKESADSIYIWRGFDTANKLKEAGTDYWKYPNTGATNESGFSARPGGDRLGANGIFDNINVIAKFWTNSDYYNIGGFYRSLINDMGKIYNSYGDFKMGLSVRCIKDDKIQTITLEDIQISPISDTVRFNETRQFNCIALWSDSSTTDVTDLTFWGILPGNSGNIDENGIFTADSVKLGIETITATFQEKSAQTSVIVLPNEPNVGLLKDIDNNFYKTKKIGDQWWMAENLKVTRYRNGSHIPNVTDTTQWANLDNGAYCYNGDNSANADVYGALYNWYAVSDSRNLAPEGWHVPNEEDWKQLMLYLGMSEFDADFTGWRGAVGGKLKETGIEHWISPNTGATNESGFTALPGGSRDYFDGSYDTMGIYASFWSSASVTDSTAWSHLLLYDRTTVGRLDNNYGYAFSVRCVKDPELMIVRLIITPEIDSIKTNETQQYTCTAVWSDSSFTDVTNAVTWQVSPVNAGNIDDNGLFTPNPDEFGHVIIKADYMGYKEFARLIVWPADPNLGLVLDIDGNYYKTVKIGNQWWMAENLRVTQYLNSDPIPFITDSTEWSNLTTDGFCYYDNNSLNVFPFGTLYNWYSITDSRQLAPKGWHIPGDDEWKELELYLGMNPNQVDNFGFRGTDQGGKLKAAGTAWWLEPNTGATNETNFSAQPGGYRAGTTGAFAYIGEGGYYWTETETSPAGAYVRMLSYLFASISRFSDDKGHGFSVRCVKDGALSLVKIKVTAETDSILAGETLQFFCTATWSDSSTTDVTDSAQWTVYNITAGSINNNGLLTPNSDFYGTLIIAATFQGQFDKSMIVIIPVDPDKDLVTDIEGNIYRTKKIGNQWWMAENLKVTRYQNGDHIPNITDNIEWVNQSSGAYCYYDNNIANAHDYGALYNWYTAEDPRNIAPEGWHVPTDEDWKQLEIYLGMDLDTADSTGYRGTDEGGKLKEVGTIHWNAPNSGATNESGFSAGPGGFRGYFDGGFLNMGNSAYFWSATEYDDNTAWYRKLGYDKEDVKRSYDNNKQIGFSVRCVKDY